jgi:hypothetical protein
MESLTPDPDRMPATESVMGAAGLIGLAVALHMPERSEVARLWAEQAARKGTAARLYLERARPATYDLHAFAMPHAVSEPIEGFAFEVVGRIVATPTHPWTWQLAPTGGLQDELTIEAWWMAVPISPSLRAVRNYEPMTGAYRRALELTAPTWELEWQQAKGRLLRAMRALDWTLTKPGPKPGTGAKYATPDAWYAALNEHVRPRQSKVTADQRQFAAWLGLESPSTLFKYMGLWGPPHIQDLREGRF